MPQKLKAEKELVKLGGGDGNEPRRIISTNFSLR